MKKSDFIWILQVALLEFEGKAEKLIPCEEPSEEVIDIGKKLSNYLKSINIEVKNDT